MLVMELRSLKKFLTIDFLVVALAIAILVAVLGFKIFFIFSPEVGFDDAGLGYIARGIINGETPYQDLFDHKPPLTYYMLAAFFTAFEDSLQTVHLFAALFGISLLVIIFVITKAILDWKSALLATAFSSVFFFTNIPAMEIPMTLFGLLGFYFYLQYYRQDKPLMLFLTGIFIGISIWFKQPGILFLIAVMAHYGFVCRKNKYTSSKIFKGIALLFIGVLIVSIPLLSYVIYTSGFSNFWYAVVTFNFLFSGSASRIFVIGKLVLLLLSMFGFLIPLLIIKPSKKNIMRTFFLTFISIMIMFFLINKEIFEQHLIQIIPFISILAASTYTQSRNQIRKICATLSIIFILSSALLFLNTFVRAENNQQDVLNEIKLEIGSAGNVSVFSDNPIYSFLGHYKNNYRFFYIAPSIASVFDLSDFCEFSDTQDYLILTHRKNFLGPDNLQCIKEKFTLKKKIEPVGESFVEVWMHN